MRKFRTAAVAVTGAVALTTSLVGLGAPQAQAADPAAPSDYASVVKADKPSHYWRFEDLDTQSYTQDEVGGTPYQHNGYEGVPSLPNGALGTGLQNPVGSVAADDLTGRTDYTLEEWVQVMGEDQGMPLLGVVDQQTHSPSIEVGRDGALVFRPGAADGPVVQGGHVADYEWHHVVATSSGTDGIRLYLDGKLVGQDPRTVPVAGKWLTAGSGQEVSIEHVGTVKAFFNGWVDEVATYDAPLTADQVAHHYAVATGPQAARRDANGNQLPTPAFTATCTNDMQCALDASASSDADGSIVSWKWHLDAGVGGLDLDGQQATFLFWRPGPLPRHPDGDR